LIDIEDVLAGAPPLFQGVLSCQSQALWLHVYPWFHE
jgi:hypothetical protein